MELDPIDVVRVTDAVGLRRAFHRVFQLGNPVGPEWLRHEYPPPPILKHAGVKTWSAFARNARCWDIGDTSGAWQIVGHKKKERGFFVQDDDQRVSFPPGATVDEVIDRMIAILQEHAGVVP